MIWLIAAAAVLIVVTVIAVQKVGPMPERLAKVDEEFNLIFRETRLTQRPASERFKDQGGQP